MSGTCFSCENTTTDCERCDTSGVCPCCPCECYYPDPSPAARAAMAIYDAAQEVEEAEFHDAYMALLASAVQP